MKNENCQGDGGEIRGRMVGCSCIVSVGPAKPPARSVYAGQPYSSCHLPVGDSKRCAQHFKNNRSKKKYEIFFPIKNIIYSEIP